MHKAGGVVASHFQSREARVHFARCTFLAAGTLHILSALKGTRFICNYGLKKKSTLSRNADSPMNSLSNFCSFVWCLFREEIAFESASRCDQLVGAHDSDQFDTRQIGRLHNEARLMKFA
jgi:hypothetical protein